MVSFAHHRPMLQSLVGLLCHPALLCSLRRGDLAALGGWQIAVPFKRATERVIFLPYDRLASYPLPLIIGRNGTQT
jgi:hypothetical protein